MADWYIEIDAASVPVRPLPATALADPLTEPRASKRWYKPANLVDAVVGPTQRRTGPFFENLDQPVATVRYATTPLPIAELRQSRLAGLAAQRLAVETAGVAVGTIVVPTDLTPQAKIIGAARFADRNPTTTIAFKARDGWHDVGAAEAQAIFDAASAHVDACHEAERARYDAIMALTDPDAIVAYDIHIG